jgi:hypothetical protein
MLFQRLYNWIKYKTLPPSILFKNRLFIERDSKHRRIFNNFGLVFRNSKWSNYEMRNIRSQFQWAYFKSLFWLFLITVSSLVLFKFNDYYMNFYVFNNVAFLFWALIDSFDYYLSFLVWISTLVTSLIINLVYSYFFFNNFSDKEGFKKYFSNSFFHSNKLITKLTENQTTVSKHEYGPILYSWLTSHRTERSTRVLESIFKTNFSVVWWNNYHDFFFKLYKLSLLCSLADNSRSIYYLNIAINRLSNFSFKSDYGSLLAYLGNTAVPNKYCALTISYFLNNYENYFFKKNTNAASLKILSQHCEWNPASFTNETANYNYLLNAKNGLFFSDDLSFGNLASYLSNYEELLTSQIYIKNITNAAKWNRWLYRYSILHRKVLKNSHKLTITKRLFNSGFYSNSLFTRNAWAAENFKKYSNNEKFFNNAALLYYGNFSVNDNAGYGTNLRLLSFYESSFFWLLKRFYDLNSLPFNFIKSSLNLNPEHAITKNQQANWFDNSISSHRIFLFYTLKANSHVFDQFSHLRDVTNNDKFFTSNGVNIISNLSPFFIKDLSVVSADNDLINYDNLETLYWATSSSINESPRFPFFNYLTTGTFFDRGATYKFYYTANCKNLEELNRFLMLSVILEKSYYINDLFYYSWFY